MSIRSEHLVQQLEAIIDPVCLVHRVELVEVRYLTQKDSAVIRITIDRVRTDGKDGSDITLADCTDVSRDVSAALDVHEDLIPCAYHLEVGSPGLERPLVRPADYERFRGREIKLRTSAPIGSDKRKKFQGDLIGLDTTEPSPVVEMSVEGEVVRIPLHAIAQANLVYRF